MPSRLCCIHSTAAHAALVLLSQLHCSHSSAAFTAPLSTQLYCLHSSAVPTAPLPSQLRCARRPAALTAQVLSRLRCAHGSLVYRPASGERVLPASTCGFAQLPLLLPLLLLPHTRCCLCSPRRYCRLLRCCSAVHALARLRAPALASYVRALTRRASFHEPCSLLSATRFRALHARLLPPLWPGGASRVHLPSPHGLQAEPVSGLALGCYELPRLACHLLHRPAPAAAPAARCRSQTATHSARFPLGTSKPSPAARSRSASSRPRPAAGSLSAASSCSDMAPASSIRPT